MYTHEAFTRRYSTKDHISLHLSIHQGLSSIPIVNSFRQSSDKAAALSQPFALDDHQFEWKVVPRQSIQLNIHKG